MTEISYQQSGYQPQYSAQRQSNLLAAVYTGYQPGYEDAGVPPIGPSAGGPRVGDPVLANGTGGMVSMPNGVSSGLANSQPLDPTDLVLRRGPTISPERQDSQASRADQRPSTAPGSKQLQLTAPQDDSDHDVQQRRPSKPMLLRSKSEHGVRQTEQLRSNESEDEETTSETGARHGFEDHYARKDIMQQLMNVGWALCGRLDAMQN